jgi:hypothetical protein
VIYDNQMTDSGAKANRSEVMRTSTFGLYLLPIRAEQGRQEPKRHDVGSRQGVFAQFFRRDDYFRGVSFASPTASAFMAAASHT